MIPIARSRVPGAQVSRSTRNWLWSLGSAAALLGAWQLTASLVPPIILPPIDVTVAAFGALLSEPGTWRALSESLLAYVAGFGAAAVIGATIGIASGLNPRVRALFAPLLALCNSVPTVAWMGLAMIWFGLGVGPVVFLVAVTTTPLLAAALDAAVRGRDPLLDELAEQFELPSPQRLWHVTLPPLIGSARAALTTMAGLGWKLTVMGEFLTASRGLGKVLVEAKAHLQTDRVIAVTALLVITWALIDALITTLARARNRPQLRLRSRPGPPTRTRAERPNATDLPVLRADRIALAHDGDPIASEITLELRPGRAVAVLGPSGVGKSTLLRVLGGLHAPAAGSVRRAPGLRTATVFQEDRLLPWRSVAQNVALFSGAPEALVRQRLGELGLSAAADRPPAELSGGMRRRVALARGFLRDAEVLLLDEPFAGLDPLRRATLIDDIDRMRGERSRTIVFVTHDVDDALLLADEALVLGGPAPATVIARIDLTAHGSARTLSDPALAEPRAQLLGALLGSPQPRPFPELTPGPEPTPIPASAESSSP